MKLNNEIKGFLKWILILSPTIIGGLLLVNNIFSCDFNLWGGGGQLLTGLGLSFFLLRRVIWGEFDFKVGGGMFALGVLLSIIGVFSSSKALDRDYVNLRSDLKDAFIDASNNCQGDRRSYLNAAQVCAMAPVMDLMDLNYQLMKAKYLPPTASLIDGVYHSNDGAKVDACLVSYFSFSTQCPNSFVTFNLNHPEMKSVESLKQCSSFWQWIQSWV
ncbi:hypothetical protein A7J58_02410 [Enterobacter cloacae]|nr:hypothetical protein [Escherichia coli]OAE43116.1 hypothetical protein A7J56_02395 [Enterobacter cloacae]OAE69369.1 hypothetical protein A7J58_02410 [Enterobacter cloacae]